MLKKILVPLDGSVTAEQALTYAADLALKTDAALLLVRAAIAHTLAGVDGRERRAGAIQEAEDYLAQTQNGLVQRGFACESRVPYGHPAQSIVEFARLYSADLIVMSSHGRTGPGRLLLGSVAESVVANSSVPTLVARAWLPPHRQPFLPEQPTLIVPLDGSSLAEAALAPALALADDLSASVLLLRAIPPEEAGDEAQDYLTQVQTRLLAEVPLLDAVTQVRWGDAPEVIDSAILDTQASMVIMATHGRGGLLRSVTGSVAGKLVQRGRAPVVLVRPQSQEASFQRIGAYATP